VDLGGLNSWYLLSQKSPKLRDRTIRTRHDDYNIQLEANEVRFSLTAPTEIRQRAIALLEQLPSALTKKRANFV
jgi:hypothetical protein